MDFSGRKYATVDEKGRVLLPVEFKTEMGGSIPGDQLVVEMDAHEKCLNLYTVEVWQEHFTSLKSKLNRNNREQSRVLDRLYSNFKVLQVPENGRINLPNNFLAKVNIVKDVIFTGQGDRIRLWDVGEHEAYEESMGDFSALYDKYFGGSEDSKD
ncbi:MAG: division/cell wall cluster transcriptional repressor MraZ [Mangrovibacterium sp.]